MKIINPNKIINKKQHYDISLDEKSAIKRLNKLNFTTDEKNLENYYALLSSIINNSNLIKNYNIKEKINLIKNMNAFKKFITVEIAKIIEYIISNQKTKELEMYIVDNIVPYYKNNFTINKSREISLLPIDLRLYVYITLLNNEECIFTSLNYCDRLAITLAKFGYKDLASIVVGNNWVLNWGEYRDSDNNKALKIDIDGINSIKDIRKQILNRNNINPNQRLDELNYSVGTFSNKKIVQDTEAARIIMPLLKIYYDDIPNISENIDCIINYLGDKGETLPCKLKNMQINAETNMNKIYNMPQKEIALDAAISQSKPIQKKSEGGDNKTNIKKSIYDKYLKNLNSIKTRSELENEVSKLNEKLKENLSNEEKFYIYDQLGKINKELKYYNSAYKNLFKAMEISEHEKELYSDELYLNLYESYMGYNQFTAYLNYPKFKYEDIIYKLYEKVTYNTQIDPIYNGRIEKLLLQRQVIKEFRHNTKSKILYYRKNGGIKNIKYYSELENTLKSIDKLEASKDRLLFLIESYLYLIYLGIIFFDPQSVIKAINTLKKYFKLDETAYDSKKLEYIAYYNEAICSEFYELYDESKFKNFISDTIDEGVHIYKELDKADILRDREEYSLALLRKVSIASSVKLSKIDIIKIYIKAFKIICDLINKHELRTEKSIIKQNYEEFKLNYVPALEYINMPNSILYVPISDVDIDNIQYIDNEIKNYLH